MAAFLVLLLLLITPAVHVVGQPGFLSIDCGQDDKFSGFKDPDTGIIYVSDGPYTDAGENLKVSATYESDWPRLYTTVRSFPSGVLNCYALPTETGAKYLVRMEASYGNHDGKNLRSIEFDLHLGANYWDTVYVGDDAVYEAIFLAWASWAPVCLVNTGRGAPFLSYLELRKFPSTLYPFVTSSQALNMYGRENMGGEYTRYPDDPYDRDWDMKFDPQWSNLSATPKNIQQDPSYVVPQNVIQKAVTAIGNDTAISYTWTVGRTGYAFMVVLHFADFQSTQTRQFDIYFNGYRAGLSEKPFSPKYLASSSVYSEGWYRAPDSTYNITLIATPASELPPMVNAIEIYSQLALGGPMTLPKDFDAIMAIKLGYGVKKNWMGDPCFPVKYAWDGVECSNTSDSTMRITSL